MHSKSACNLAKDIKIIINNYIPYNTLIFPTERYQTRQ